MQQQIAQPLAFDTEAGNNLIIFLWSPPITRKNNYHEVMYIKSEGDTFDYVKEDFYVQHVDSIFKSLIWWNFSLSKNPGETTFNFIKMKFDFDWFIDKAQTLENIQIQGDRIKKLIHLWINMWNIARCEHVYVLSVFLFWVVFMTNKCVAPAMLKVSPSDTCLCMCWLMTAL